MGLFSRTIFFKPPERIESDAEGYVWLSALTDQIMAKNHTYIIDLSDVNYISANLCAVFGAIIDLLRSKGFRISVKESNHGYLNAILKRNGFMAMYGIVPKHLPTAKSSIPYKKFENEDLGEFVEYLYRYVINKDELPKMSKSAKDSMATSILEIITNCQQHSNTSEVYICGQFFPGYGKMLVTIVDLGRTIVSNVRNHNDDYKDMSGKECVKWAVQSRNTTKPKTEAGGLGFDIMRRFVKLNEGSIQLVSGTGYWEECSEGEKLVEMSSSFEGTIVTLEINLKDNKAYFTVQELEALKQG